MQPPLAARRQQSVDREDAQHLFPVGAFAVQRQARAEKIIEVKGAPQFVAQPARAPLPRTFQPQRIQAHLHRRRATRRGEPIYGKERHLLCHASALVEDRDRTLPRQTLTVVDLAQVQDMPLRHLAVAIAPALHHRPRAMFFAVLPAGAALQKHDRSLPVAGSSG